jgi:hypothetical protein
MTGLWRMVETHQTTLSTADSRSRRKADRAIRRDQAMFSYQQNLKILEKLEKARRASKNYPINPLTR